MKTKTINLYSFSELSEDAKKKALDGLRSVNVEYHKWYDFIEDEWVEKLNEEGFVGATVYFSGFSSQGDGACFDADIDITKFTDNKRLLALASQTEYTIQKNSYASHYSHERTRYVDFNSITTRTTQSNIHKAMMNLCAAIEAKRLELSRELYRALEKAHDDLISDKQIIETINANEWTFTENGKLEN